MVGTTVVGGAVTAAFEALMVNPVLVEPGGGREIAVSEDPSIALPGEPESGLESGAWREAPRSKSSPSSCDCSVVSRGR